MAETTPEPLTFEQALAELERLVHELEDGQTELETALGHYEKGIGLLKRCYAQLAEAEQRILKLSGTAPDGSPVTESFAHASTASQSQVAPEPKKRRTKKMDGPEIPF
jgi:exodeoxyribonuclease VII small subunit